MNEEGAGNHSNLLSLLSKSSKIVNDHGYAEMTVNLSDDNTMIKRVWPRTTFPSQMHRWNIPEEVLSYLISYTSHTQWTTHHVPIKPCSGTMLLYNKTKTKYYKGDGHDWKTRNSSTKTVREDRTKLKVCGHTLLYGCYTRSESNPQFHRRCYWLIKNPSLVLVHYLDTSNSSRTATVATMKKVTDQEVTIFEETSVSDISLIAVSDQDLCQYLSRTAVSICSSLQTLSEQVLLISNELHRDATLTDFITVIKQRIYLEEKSVTQKPSQSLQSLPPHVLLINQAIHLLQLQAQSCQYGNQSLLPKGISTLSPSLLLKAASYLMHNSQQSNEEEEPHPSPSVSTPTSQLPNIDADFTQPLQPVSIETLKAVLPGELDPEPSSTDYKDNDFNMADFTKFAHSLITMNPLKDAEHLMHSSSQNQVLETSSTSSQNADNISDTFFQQFFQELTMVPPTSSTHHQMSLDPQPEFNADNYLQVPPLSNADHTYFNPPTSPIDYSLLEGLDPDSLKVLLELSNNDGGLVEGESLSPVSQYMASLRDEVDDHVALEDESCDNHMIIDDQVNDTIGPGWNTSVQQQGTSITMATHNLLDEGSFDTTLLPESHDLSSDPPLGSGDLQFANSLLQHHVSDQPTDLSLSHTPSPLPYAQIPESSSGYHTSSPFQSPSSPSLASVSSLSTAGGDSYFDEPPLVAELCELLSESPNVQHTDFSHLSLSDSEQQELLEASRVIQNTLRRCKERPNPLVTLKEKHAALLIERSYKQYREIKRKKDEAARCIQHQYRLYRRRTIELQRAALFIQQMYRYQRRKRTNITMTTTSSPHSSMTSSSYNMYRYNSH